MATATSTRPMQVAERQFKAMGTDCHIVVVCTDGRANDGPPGPAPLQTDAAAAADGALRRIGQLEQRWSRFLPDSEVSLLNRERSLQVSNDTFLLIERAVFAWQATIGRFNPAMGTRLCRLGYDRQYDDIASHPTEPAPNRLDRSGATSCDKIRNDNATAPGCAGIILDPFTSSVWLPDDVSFDPGGIGKGLAADIVSAELMDIGAAGVLVNLGGDLRTRGYGPTGGAWLIEIREPAISSSPITTVAITNGAVASSTPLRRVWSTGTDQLHHLVDPRRGVSNTTAPDMVTVVSGESWWAEAAATALAASTDDTSGRSTADARVPQTATLVIGRTESGELVHTRSGGFAAYEVGLANEGDQNTEETAA